MDLADAPRRAFVVTLQIAILLPITLVLLALTQPFLAGLEGVLVVIGLAVARDRILAERHEPAGPRVGRRARDRRSSRETNAPGESSAAVTLEPVRSVLPGLGRPVALRLAGDESRRGEDPRPTRPPRPNGDTVQPRSSAARITSSCRPLRRYCAKRLPRAGRDARRGGRQSVADGRLTRRV